MIKVTSLRTRNSSSLSVLIKRCGPFHQLHRRPRSSWKRKGMNILLGNAKSDPEEGDGNADGNRPTHLKDPFVLQDCPKVEGVEFLMEQLHLLKGWGLFYKDVWNPLVYISGYSSKIPSQLSCSPLTPQRWLNLLYHCKCAKRFAQMDVLPPSPHPPHNIRTAVCSFSYFFATLCSQTNI